MFSKAFRKLIEILLSLIAVMSLTFFMIRSLPGGPYDEESYINPVIKNELEKSWGLHDSLFLQWIKQLWSLFTGDWGHSLIYNERVVTDIILQSFRISIGLIGISFVFAVVSLYFFLKIDFLKSESTLKKYLTQICFVLNALPHVFVAPLLLYFFSFYWDLLPAAYLNTASSYILPVTALTLRPIAQNYLILSQQFQFHSQANYVRYALAKGLSPHLIYRRYYLAPFMTLIMTQLGTLFASLVTSTFVVELIFSINGIGTLFVQSLFSRDYTVILPLVFMIVSLIMLTQAIFERLGSRYSIVTSGDEELG